MANVMTDLFREIERRIESRRQDRIGPAKPLTLPGEKRTPKLPTWSNPPPHRPEPYHHLRTSHLV